MYKMEDIYTTMKKNIVCSLFIFSIFMFLIFHGVRSVCNEYSWMFKKRLNEQQELRERPTYPNTVLFNGFCVHDIVSEGKTMTAFLFRGLIFIFLSCYCSSIKPFSRVYSTRYAVVPHDQVPEHPYALPSIFTNGICLI